MHSRSFLLNTLLLLCGCTFCIYQLQEVALERASDLNRDHYRPPILSAYQISHEEEDEVDAKTEPRNELSSHRSNVIEDDIDAKNTTTTTSTKKKSKIWITMALCWSNNTHYHGKNNFPYKAAAPLSSRLWMRLTPAKVILQIVYAEDEISDELKEYKRDLEWHGATVKLVKADESMTCVLKAQLIRLLAFQMPQVRPYHDSTFHFQKNKCNA